MIKLLAALLLGAVLAIPAKATTIEGFTPSGNFQTVGVSDLGALFVTIVSTTPQHVVTDTGSVITSILDPVTVIGTPSSSPIPVYGPGGGPVAVSGSLVVHPSSATTQTNGQVSIGVTPFTILASNPSRVQSIICNQDPSLTVWVGDASVSKNTGIALGAGGCMSPDGPASFSGALFGISSTTTTGKVGKIEFF